MLIRDLMSSDVITTGPDTPLKEAARRMLEAGVSGLPVTDEERLVGIITEADFVSTEADRRAPRRGRLLRLLVRRREIPSEERLVRDLMTTDVAVMAPDADHVEAARLMEKKGVKRLPVVEEGKLVGLISRADILKSFIRPDKEIIDEIGHVIRKVLWIDARRVTVRCIDGNVVLTGRLETRSDATLLVQLTKRLDGVASVDTHLTWEVDNTKLQMVSQPPAYPPRRDWVGS